VICDIFAAGEKPIDGISSEGLVRLAREAGHEDITYLPRREDLATWIDDHAKTGDLVITLGAGNIQLVCNDVIELLEKRFGPATKKNLVRVAESSATVAR
jgi:UDP-N-acetylmuramate--alanine ligase